jgi:hypothetical protein
MATKLQVPCQEAQPHRFVDLAASSLLVGKVAITVAAPLLVGKVVYRRRCFLRPALLPEQAAAAAMSSTRCSMASSSAMAAGPHKRRDHINRSGVA